MRSSFGVEAFSESMRFGKEQYKMSSTANATISNGFHFDSTIPGSRTQQNQQKSFDTGNSDKSSNKYGLRSPISPASDFMSATESPHIEHFMVTTGSPVMNGFESTANIHSSNNFLSTAPGTLFDNDLYPLQPQPDTQYGTMKPAWMYDGQQLPWSNEQTPAGIGVTLAPELTRLDTQLPQQHRPMFDPHYGQPTPPEDTIQSNEASETAISPSSLSGGGRRISTRKHRKNSTLTQSADEVSSTSTKPRRQRKVQARKESTSSTVDLDEDEKREASLARNRIAASKCRDKKKKWTAGLEEKERNLRLENKVLQAHKAALTNELLLLKNRALDHMDCKCDPVREYLMISARERIVEMKKQGRTEDMGGQGKTEEETRDLLRRRPSARRLSDASDSSSQIGQLLHSRSNSFSFKISQDGGGSPLG